MRKLIAKLLGWKVVWLVDFDGEVSYRLAKPTKKGMRTWRISRFFKIGLVYCLPDGYVRGPSFVHYWSSTKPETQNYFAPNKNDSHKFDLLD